MFLPVTIEENGYIKTQDVQRRLIHRECRSLHHEHVASPTLNEAKERCRRTNSAILELTSEGGGNAVWVKACDEEIMRNRLTVYKSCYGKWDVRVMSE